MGNYNLRNILSKIMEKMDKPELRMFRDIAVDVVSIYNPVIGVAAETTNKFISDYSTYKLTLLLKGLSSNSNMEKRMNELYNYITKSDENTINIANVFKKTINAESPKACLIYGLIVAKHLDNDENFTQEELLVCKALENGTDQDLCLFKDIMERFVSKVEDEGESIILPQDLENRGRYINTCDWCVYNRIFVMENVKFVDPTLKYGKYYYASAPANILLKYIDDLHRIWNYQ